MNVSELRQVIESQPARSAWARGRKAYALELIDQLEESISNGDFAAEKLTDREALELHLLNGAYDWNQYSWGGSSLIYDGDIAKRLCTPSELKKTHNGERRPNAREEWLDTQARALNQAASRILRATKGRV
jgi:hypothetical protein